MNYFRIHFIHKNCGSPARAWRDDILTIFPRNGNGQHTVEYLDKDSRLKYSFSLHEEYLYDYIHTILLNLVEDTDPFESIQIICPGLPTTLLSVESLGRSEIRAQVHDNMKLYLQIQGTLRSAEYIPPALRGRRRRAVEEESDGDSSSDSSSDSSEEDDVSDQEEQEENSGAAGDDVDEDGFQRLPRELDEEPTAHGDDTGPTGEGAAEPARVPPDAPPVGPEGAAGAPTTAPLGNTTGIPVGPNGTFPFQTFPMYWTVWMPYR